MRNIFLIVALFLSIGRAQAQTDSVKYYKAKCDTLNHKLYVANKRIAEVDHYLSVCKKNKKNRVFLYGWLTNNLISSK